MIEEKSLYISPVELRRSLVTAERSQIRALSDRLLFDRPLPYCLEESPDTYEELKSSISSSLGVDIKGIQFVGSGCIGYSVAPKKFPNKFHEESDIDIAIIDEKLFDEIWELLRFWHYPRKFAKNIPSVEEEWINYEKNAIFWGWMDLHSLKVPGVIKKYELNRMKELRTNWFHLFKSISNNFPNSSIYGRKVSARLYRSKSHLSQYHANGLEMLQRDIKSKNNMQISRIIRSK